MADRPSFKNSYCIKSHTGHYICLQTKKKMKKIIIISIALICALPSLQAQTSKKKPVKKVTKKISTKPVVKTGTVTVSPTIDSVKIYEAMAAKKQQEAMAAAKKQQEAIAAAKKIQDAADSAAKKAIEAIIPSSTTPPSTVELPGTINTGNTATNNGSSINTGGSNSNSDIISGLKQALQIGTENSSKKLNKLDGFFADAAIKILMPEEAKKVEKTLRNLGMGELVDNAILSMNRAAEDAAGGIGNIFWDAIKQMNISDGLQILRGGDFAATEYLKKTTTAVLTSKFKPVIESSLGKTGATKYWTDVFSAYNNFSSTPVNTDLTGYVTEKALTGLFYNIGLEEQKIRKDPVAQVTGLLKQIFGGKK